MKFISTCFLFLFLLGNTIAQSSNSKSTFVVTINGQKHTISEGDELIIPPSTSETTVSVEQAEFKKFNGGILSFNYPSNFSYQFEQDTGYKNWTIDGNDFVVMHFEFNNPTPLNAIVKGMVSEFGKKNCKVSDTQITVGKNTLSGQRIDVALVGQKLSIDFLEIIADDGKSRFIAFQDSKNDFGGDSEESLKALKMINKTIVYK